MTGNRALPTQHEGPLRKLIRVTMLLKGGATGRLRADAAAELDRLEAVADDALALLDQHISEEQRRELGIRIIDRMTEIGRLT
jgi:hypothetical protein